MKHLVLLAVGGALTSCVQPPYPIVEKDGVSTQEMNRDMADCVQQRDNSVTLGPFISRCMEAKGYRVLVRNS